jgi:UDP-2,3-diacylglucosamine hydrolase
MATRPTSRPTLIVSDAHLGAVPAPNERAFGALLERVPSMAAELLINGDLFDFWFEYRTVILRRHFHTLRRLTDVVGAGVRVRLLGGNHDGWGGDFLREEIGLELLDGPIVTEVGGRTAYVAHGDGLGGGDLGYRVLKRLTRSGPGRSLFRLVHPDLGTRVALRASATSQKHLAGPGGEDARADHLSAHAERILRADGSLQLVVFGHAHRPELREVEPGRFYLNAGDWIHHLTYALVDPNSIQLLTWDGDPD